MEARALIVTVLIGLGVRGGICASTNPPAPVPDCYVQGLYGLPHQDCDKYWICYNHEATLEQCPEGLYWNAYKATCDFPENVNTENCLEPGETQGPTPSTEPPASQTSQGATSSEPSTTTAFLSTPTVTSSPGQPDCSSEGVYYLPHEDCDKYWTCSNGEAVLGQCSPGLYWNDKAVSCDYPANVDTSNCREPGQSTSTAGPTTTVRDSTTSKTTATTTKTTSDPPSTTTATPTVIFSTTSSSPETIECDATGDYYVPAEHCSDFWRCVNGVAFINTCPPTLVWNQEMSYCDYPENVDTSNCIMD